MITHPTPPACRSSAALLALFVTACATGPLPSGSIHGGASPAADGGAPDAGFAPAAHRSLPLLAAGAGHVLAPLRLVMVVASNDPLKDSLFAYGDALATSAWLPAVANEYGGGSVEGSTHAQGAPLAPGTALTKPQLIAYITDAINGVPGTAPNGNALYLLLLPPGVFRVGVPNEACNGRGAFHGPFDAMGDGYGVVQRCNQGLNHVTAVGGHEVAEAVTDTGGTGWAVRRAAGLAPWEGSVWVTYDGDNAENGDLCINTRIQENGIYYQRSFSNAAATAGGDPCVPALPVPYYSVSTAQDWYAGAAGTTVQVPLTGWSAAAAADWLLSARADNTSDPALTFGLTLSSSRQTSEGGTDYPVLNNGERATLAVSIPAGAPSGSWVGIYVESFRLDPATGLRGPPGEDLAHNWMVGVYVP